jgi:hypothetical protein
MGNGGFQTLEIGIGADQKHSATEVTEVSQVRCLSRTGKLNFSIAKNILSRCQWHMHSKRCNLPVLLLDMTEGDETGYVVSTQASLRQSHGTEGIAIAKHWFETCKVNKVKPAGQDPVEPPETPTGSPD